MELETLSFQTPARDLYALWAIRAWRSTRKVGYVLHFILLSYPHLTSQFWLFVTASRGKIPQHLFWVSKSEYVLSSSILSLYGDRLWNPTECDFYYCFLPLKFPFRFIFLYLDYEYGDKGKEKDSFCDQWHSRNNYHWHLKFFQTFANICINSQFLTQIKITI